MLNENADHKAHHPESEHYSDSEHAHNLHKAFKDARRKMTDKEVSRNGSASEHHARHQSHMGFHDPTIGNSDNHSQSKLHKTLSRGPSAIPVDHTPKNHLEKTGTIKHASGHHVHVYHLRRQLLSCSVDFRLILRPSPQIRRQPRMLNLNKAHRYRKNKIIHQHRGE